MTRFPRRISGETVLSTHPFTVTRSVFESPEGKRYERSIVEHPGAVVILPVTTAGTLLFVRQYRTALQKELLELPAGTLEAGEEPAACASRELEEEIGYKPGKLLFLSELYPAPGFCSERQFCYAAFDLAPSRKPGDEDEDIEVVEVAVAEVAGLATSGALRDGKSLAVVYLAQSLGLIPSGGGGGAE